MNAIDTLPTGQWVLRECPRVTPLPVPRRSRITRAALAYIRRRTGAAEDFNVFTTFARMRSYMPVHAWLVGRLLADNQLTTQEKEQVIVRVAWRMGCAYEFAHHHHMALALGIDHATLQRLTHVELAGFDPRLHAMLTLTDELVITRLVSDVTWATTRHFLSEDEILELCFVVSHYVMVAMTINVTGIQPEASFLAALAEGRHP